MQQEKYDRRLITAIPNVADENTPFRLEDGFYSNEAETIIIRSTAITGRYFKKLNNEDYVEPTNR